MELKENNDFERRYDIDWLRIFAIVMIFFFHCARFFDYLGWHVKNEEADLSFMIFVVFTIGWIMPLFFVLSGMSAYYALGVQKQGEYAKTKFKRLLIPFIFGLFIIVPPQIYLEVLFWSDNYNFSGSFIEFYFFHYFTSGIYGFGGYFPLLDGVHLWYLLYLFIFSLISLKLFVFLSKEENRENVSKIAAFCNKPGALFLFVIPIIITLIIGEILPIFGTFAGWNLLCFFIFYIIGYLWASNDLFKKTIEKHGIPALIIGIIASLLIIIVFITNVVNVVSIPGVPQLDDISFMIFFVITWPLNSLCWLIVIFSIGNKYLTKDHSSLKFLNEILLPFYILHQTIIIVVGWYIIGLDLSIIVKYLIICSVSFAIIIGLIFIIRQINILRFLFGMKLKNKESIKN